MAKFRFVNCTAHPLTPDQIKAVKELLGEDVVFLEMKTLHPSLYRRLIDSPSSPKELQKLASAMAEWMGSFTEPTVFQLPIGSPAFNTILAWEYADRFDSQPAPPFVMAHTSRKVKEVRQPDGSVKKMSVFKFECFIPFSSDMTLEGVKRDALVRSEWVKKQAGRKMGNNDGLIGPNNGGIYL